MGSKDNASSIAAFLIIMFLVFGVFGYYILVLKPEAKRQEILAAAEERRRLEDVRENATSNPAITAPS